MRTVAMRFSLLHVPRCKTHTLASSCWDSFQNLSRTSGNTSGFNFFSSNIYGLQGEHSRRWTRRPVTTSTEGRNKNPISSKTSTVRHEISEVTISTSTELNIHKSEISETDRIQYCDIRQKIAENKDLAKLITVIAFDFETTGFSRDNGRIIEMAIRDLSGGENSTFQTLVNPECFVPNQHIHGISTHMVNRPDVPRMKELIPILLQYVRSRQKPGGYVLWVAHNARCFDVPFLSKEFRRCSFEIPPNWLFVDTLPLAREVMKNTGSKVAPKISLQALREYYRISLVGNAHRAMSDVNALSLILQRITFDLKLTLPDLVEKSFRDSDLINNVKKKKNSS